MTLWMLLSHNYRIVKTSTFIDALSCSLATTNSTMVVCYLYGYFPLSNFGIGGQPDDKFEPN